MKINFYNFKFPVLIREGKLTLISMKFSIEYLDQKTGHLRAIRFNSAFGIPAFIDLLFHKEKDNITMAVIISLLSNQSGHIYSDHLLEKEFIDNYFDQLYSIRDRKRTFQRSTVYPEKARQNLNPSFNDSFTLR